MTTSRWSGRRWADCSSASSSAGATSRRLTAVLVLLSVSCTTAGEPATTTSAHEPINLPTTTGGTITTITLPPTTMTSQPPSFAWSIGQALRRDLAHSWSEGCPVGPESLAAVKLTHFDFDGSVRHGEIVVAAEYSDDVVTVFAALFEAGYPIGSVVPIGRLPEGAEDQPGYSNTSGFHCRLVAGTTRWSEHALGKAIDINPHLNPFVRGDEIWPKGSEPYRDRSLGTPGMIDEGGVVVSAFDAIGWEWGGRWQTLKDYHHFSASGR